MSITLSLTPEAAQELERRAAELGIDVPAFIQSALEEKLADERSPAAALSYSEWRSEFQRWIGSHHSRNPQVDDSRESMYD